MGIYGHFLEDSQQLEEFVANSFCQGRALQAAQGLLIFPAFNRTGFDHLVMCCTTAVVASHFVLSGVGIVGFKPGKDRWPITQCPAAGPLVDLF